MVIIVLNIDPQYLVIKNVLITTIMIIFNLSGQNMVLICEPYLALDLQMPAGFFVLFLSPVNRRVVGVTPKKFGGSFSSWWNVPFL